MTAELSSIHAAFDPSERGTSKGRLVDFGGIKILFVGGQVALDGAGNVIGKDDFRRQCEVVFDSVVNCVQRAGGSAFDLVKLTCYLLDFDQFATFVAIRKEFIPFPGPASSAVLVRGLVHADLLLEVDAMAIFAGHNKTAHL